MGNLIADTFNLQEIDDFFLNETSLLYLFSLCPSRVNRAAQNTGFEMDVRTHPDIIEYGHPSIQFKLLEGPTNAEFCSLVGREPVNPLPLKINVALLGAIQAVDAVHHYGFSGTIRPDNGMYLTLSNLKINAIERLHPSKGHKDILESQENLTLSYLATVIHLGLHAVLAEFEPLSEYKARRAFDLLNDLPCIFLSCPKV